jgi:hypothetical protein
MPFNINLETEDNEVLDTIFENQWLLDFPDPRDKNYCCIKYIDRNGITVFNGLQMDDFIIEMGIYKLNSQNQAVKDLVDQIIKLAEECRRRVHLYLKFYGD